MAREQAVMAWDFLGLGIGVGETPSGEVVMDKQNFLHAVERSPSVDASALGSTMAIAGMKQSAQSKSAALQELLLPTLGVSCAETFQGKITEMLPGSPCAHLTRKNEKNGIFMQGDSLVKSNDQVGEEYCSSGGCQTSASRTKISPFKPEPMAASKMRLPSPGMLEMQHDAALTIFYAGSVRVFNNISAEQAQAIMHLASVGNVHSNMVNTMAATVTVNGMATALPQDKSIMNLPCNQTVLNHANQPTTNMQLDIGHLNIPSPLSLDPSAQPLVPTALPHARKASLSRFLEKRRERAHSKCPYGGNREECSLVEERLSSSNDPACYTAASEDVGKKRSRIPSWMLENIDVKEQNIIVL